MKNGTKIYTVSQVNTLIKTILENGLPGRLTIAGEITDWRLHHSGHCYFSLKDEDAVLPCVMWKSNFSKLKFRPENGMAVLGTGFIDVYEPRYDWGWTNHKHVFNDDAVSGYYNDVNEVWVWTELYDQTGESEDMSFMLFTDPSVCIDCADYDLDGIVDFEDLAVFVSNWLWTGSCGYNNGDLDCDGDVEFHDFAILASQWLEGCP